MAPEYKERLPIWFYPSTINAVDVALILDNCKSRSEFVEKATRFYIGYLYQPELNMFLSDALLSVMKGTVGDSENRICRLLYKLTVELGMVTKIVAQYEGLDEVGLARVRKQVMDEVNRTNGAIAFEKALRDALNTARPE